MLAYKVKGQFKMGARYTTFTKEFAAMDEKAAREKALSTIGSKHGVQRKYITIEKIEKMDPKAVTDFAVQVSIGV